VRKLKLSPYPHSHSSSRPLSPFSSSTYNPRSTHPSTRSAVRHPFPSNSGASNIYLLSQSTTMNAR
jgi:hypothetical protein